MENRQLLEKALNVFDPKLSLQGEDLERYYVARPHAPLGEMKTYLTTNRQHVKILFSGHRGSGKSTELARLAEDLRDRFFLVTVSARSLNLPD